MIAATLYHLIASSVLMVGQSYLGASAAPSASPSAGTRLCGSRTAVGRRVTTAVGDSDHLVRALNVTKSFGDHHVLKGTISCDQGQVVCLLD